MTKEVHVTPRSPLGSIGNRIDARPLSHLSNATPLGTNTTESGAATDIDRNVLLLGMSQASVEPHSRVDASYQNLLSQSSLGVKQVIDLVRANKLSIIDGRDLTRCLATEKECSAKVYTVSIQEGTKYDDAVHMYGNFNRPNFCKNLVKYFGDVSFQQIVLDYFWIPPGSWMKKHWRPEFFRVTLPDFIEKGLLEYPNDQQGDGPTFLDNQGLGYGIYLPFCLHCVEQLLASMEVIEKYYMITFVSKQHLEENSLWRGTSTIDANIMQDSLGKEKAQEDLYCTFKLADVKENMSGTIVHYSQVMKVLNSIENIKDIRMIRLTALSKYSSHKQQQICMEVGGFVGLRGL